jgi:hypothetical protein
MASRVLPALAGLITVALAGAAPASAQIRASERGQISQTVDGTTIKIDYARPRARGRDTLFGGEVKWGEVWTPGANYATTLEVDREVQVNGHAVAKGKYSVWMTVRHPDSTWTVTFDTTAKLFHTERPKEQPWQVRFEVLPESRPDFLEVLTWSVPQIRPDGVTLAMQWGRTYVPLNVTVQPSRPTTLAANLARPYNGKYDFKWVEPEPDTTAKDSSAAAGHSDSAEAHGGLPPATSFEVFYDKGSLWGKWDPAPFPGMETVLLIRKADDFFFPAVMKDGAIYDAMDDLMMEFKVERGRASGFEVRVENDELVATASRKP